MAAWQLRLISTATMIDAVRETGVHLITAKVEIRLTGVAHWPATDTIIKIEQAGLFRDFRAGAGRDKTARRCRRNWCLLITGALAQEATGADRNDSRHRFWRWQFGAWFNRGYITQFRPWRGCAGGWGRRGGGCWTWRHGHLWFRRGRRRGLCHLWRWGGGRSVSLVVRLHRGRARLKPQAMRFADDGIAADTAKLFGDLAGGRTTFPHFRQLFDALFGPAHAFKRPSLRRAKPDCFYLSEQCPVGNSCQWLARAIPH